MKKIVVASITAVAIAGSLPFVASAGNHGPRAAQGERHHGMHHAMHGDQGGMEGRHHGMKGRHGGKHSRVRMMELIEAYDADGDGSITQAEVDAWRANRLKEFDADGDGTLSLDEYQALWLDAMRERMVDAFQGHDDDGDGKVTVDEFSKRTKRMVLMRDQNDDGALNMQDVRRGPRRQDHGAGQ